MALHSLLLRNGGMFVISSILCTGVDLACIMALHSLLLHIGGMFVISSILCIGVDFIAPVMIRNAWF